MKMAIYFMLVVATVFFSQCDNDNNIGPEDQGSIPDVGMYILLPHGVETSPPDEVNLFCNVVDTFKNAVDILTVSRFSILENDVLIDPDKSNLLIRKRDTFNYHLNTILMLDVSTGMNLETLKEAARAFIQDIDAMQSIAVYTYSGTLNKIQDFTQDSGQLISAIDGITAGSEKRDLYNAIWRGFNLYSEVYSLGDVQQGDLVVFTAGDDTENERDKEEIVYISQMVNTYIIGLGNDLDLDFLNQVGNRGCLIVSDVSQLVDAFTQVQASIIKFMDSFYWISYQSSLRGTGIQEVEMSITANVYNGSGSTMKNTFDASLFEDLITGITIDWTPEEPEGVDTLYIGLNIPQKVKAYSQGGDLSPIYLWSCKDPDIMTVEPVAAGFSEAVLLASAEGSTLLNIEDTANGFTDSVWVQAVQSYNEFVLWEWWSNITGSTINMLTTDPRFPEFPSGKQYINVMEGERNFGDNYGSRLRGFVCPDVTGTYSFWIASDDASQLFLSTSENPDQKQMIANVDSWTNSHDYDAYPSQHSTDFQLEAGKYYYIEALHKEGGGGDNISVAWQGPDIDRDLIPSQNLSAWLGD